MGLYSHLEQKTRISQFQLLCIWLPKQGMVVFFFNLLQRSTMDDDGWDEPMIPLRQLTPKLRNQTKIHQNPSLAWPIFIYFPSVNKMEQ